MLYRASKVKDVEEQGRGIRVYQCLVLEKTNDYNRQKKEKGFSDMRGET